MDARIDRMKRELVQYQTELERLRSHSGGKPLSQADLIPYDVMKDAYRTLLVERVESKFPRRGGQQFQVVEPARLPERPFGPTRCAGQHRRHARRPRPRRGPHERSPRIDGPFLFLEKTPVPCSDDNRRGRRERREIPWLCVLGALGGLRHAFEKCQGFRSALHDELDFRRFRHRKRREIRRDVDDIVGQQVRDHHLHQRHV